MASMASMGVWSTASMEHGSMGARQAGSMGAWRIEHKNIILVIILAINPL